LNKDHRDKLEKQKLITQLKIQISLLRNIKKKKRTDFMQVLLTKPRTLKEFKAITHSNLKGDLVVNRYEHLHARLVAKNTPLDTIY